jgi:outer membrane cobalamin receptor
MIGTTIDLSAASSDPGDRVIGRKVDMPRRHRFSALFVVTALAFAAACASMKQKNSSDRNVITAAEIEAADANTAYDVIVKLHANYLNSRGQNSILLKQNKEPTVFLDQVEFGSINSLRTIPASNIAEIRFVSGWDAMTKYGSDHAAGVIQIYTRYQ